jgi:hypothetical protein
VVVKVSEADGTYQGIFAVDASPTATSTGTYNGGWFSDIATFAASDTANANMMVGTGQFRGTVTFPVVDGASPMTLTSNKNGNKPDSAPGARNEKYTNDAFLTKFDVTTNKAVWASSAMLRTQCASGSADCTASGQGGSVSTTSAGHVVATSLYSELTATSRRASSNGNGRLFLINGNNGNKVWEKDFGAAALAYNSEVIGEKAYVIGKVSGTNIDPFGTGTFNHTGGFFIAKVHAEATSQETDAADYLVHWPVGQGYAIVVDPLDNNYLYVAGRDVSAAPDDGTHTLPSIAGGDPCTLKGSGSGWSSGGFLAKIEAATGKCVWAVDRPTNWHHTSSYYGLQSQGLATDGTHVYVLTDDDETKTFDANHQLPVRGSEKDGFLSKYTASDGTPLWAESIGGDGADLLTSLAMSPTGLLIAGDSNSESIDMGGLKVTNLQHARSDATTALTEPGAGHLAHFALKIEQADTQLPCIDTCGPTGETSDPATVRKTGHCLIDNICAANGAAYALKPCFMCDASSNTIVENPASIGVDFCYFDDKCQPKGKSRPSYSYYNQASVCESCQPAIDARAYSLEAGHFVDKDFAEMETGRCSMGCSGSLTQISDYGMIFEMQSNGCQVLPEITPTATVDSASLSPEQMLIEAIAQVNGATAANKGAEKAWLYYHGNAASCTEAVVTYTKVARGDSTHSDVCKDTPAHKADEMGEAFDTILKYGHSVARVKVQQGLVILKAQLSNGAAAARIADLKKDTIAHMLISAYQGVIECSHKMTDGDNTAAKAAAQTQGLKYWNIVKDNLPDGPEKEDLNHMFDVSHPPSGDFNYCRAQTRLAANLPASSDLHYGAKDTDTATEFHTALGGAIARDVPYRDTLDHGFEAIDDTDHLEATANAAGKDLSETNTQGTRRYLSARDLGTLHVVLNADDEAPSCTMPPPPPPPPSPSSPSKSDSDSGLSDGEIAGVAIGATIGGIVLLGLVGLILRSIMFKEAKPIFTCLEKAPAKSPA